MKTCEIKEIGSLLREFFAKDVEPTSIAALTGDASGRQYFRVNLPGGTTLKSLVVMDFRKNLSPSDVALKVQVPAELPFLNMTRHLRTAGVPVPKIYLDASKDGFLLMEDLGDLVFADIVADKSQGDVALWYGAAIDLLAQVHKVMWPISSDCIAANKEFDYKLLRWELDHYREWGAEVPGVKQLSSTVRADLDAAFDDLAQEILAMEQGFVHRDYQSRNLMVKETTPNPSNLTIIDYQDSLIGPRVYDLVALLNDSYIDLTPDIKTKMINRYAQIAGIDTEELALEFHLVTIHRKLKDGARFVFFDKVKNNPSYLPYVEGSYTRVKQSLDALRGHQPLKDALKAASPKHFDV